MWFAQTGPSKHLSWKELACSDGTVYPKVWRKDRAVALATEFEAVRALAVAPIPIHSAYRTQAWNTHVGGTRNSQHCEGRALDLGLPEGFTVEQLYDIVLRRARNPLSSICGVGLYPTFVHMDIRPGKNLVCWKGSRAWAEVKA